MYLVKWILLSMLCRANSAMASSWLSKLIFYKLATNFLKPIFTYLKCRVVKYHSMCFDKYVYPWYTFLKLKNSYKNELLAFLQIYMTLWYFCTYICIFSLDLQCFLLLSPVRRHLDKVHSGKYIHSFLFLFLTHNCHGTHKALLSLLIT